MKRVGLAMAVVVAGAVAAPAAWASGDPYPLCNGQLNCNAGWYTSPVTVTWNLNGGQNLSSGCSTQTYSQDANQSNLSPLTPNLPPWTYCTNENATRYFFIKVELSSPTATVGPSRPPDSGGWYNHPVAGAPSATSFSGIASCTATTYAGLSTMAATVSATCVDYAGKTVAATSAPFAYDVTPPSLTASAAPGDQSVSLSWQTGGDVAPIASVSVTRSSGSAHAAGDTVYSGNATGYDDTHVRNGVRYAYTITARDQAGNASSRTTVVVPGPRLLQPAANTRLTAPPMLTWTPVRGANYYNVQLYRGGKVLSMWPKHAKLQLRRVWRFEGHRYKLKPGRYRWFVWPGFGKRSAGRYGHRIGSGTFVVVR